MVRVPYNPFEYAVHHFFLPLPMYWQELQNFLYVGINERLSGDLANWKNPQGIPKNCSC